MEISSIIELIEILRGENGCPWDRKQTPKGGGPHRLDNLSIELSSEPAY